MLSLQGLNLNTEQSKGTLTFINGTSKLYEWSDSLVSSTASSSEVLTLSSTGLRNVYETIAKSFSKQKGGYIIIDNLNVLLNFASSLVDVLDLLRYIKKLVEDSETPSRFIALLHEDGEDEALKSIAHFADIIMSVEELETGYTKEISGQVRSLCHSLDSNTDTFNRCLFYILDSLFNLQQIDIVTS